MSFNRPDYLEAVLHTLVGQIDALVAAGERSMTALVNTVDAQRIVVADSRALTNVNTVAELPAAR